MRKKKINIPQHGTIRGLNSTLSSSIFEGKFGRMFRTLSPAVYGSKPGESEENLKTLAAEMFDKETGDQTSEDKPDDEENSAISAGYTYLGQFIDHDITFDPASSLQKQNDPDGLTDFRTPRFDLDSVYGKGPDDQPYLYDFSESENGSVKMLLGKALSDDNEINSFDLPRNNPIKKSMPKRALIGDPRNDENIIVSQLHGMMLRFHNRVVDYKKSKGLDASFKTVQRIVRWHYQWIVLHDFLPTIIQEEVLKGILPHISKGSNVHTDKPVLNFFNWHNEPFMPVEFSGAAYRFGHSMVRPIYRLNNIDRKVVSAEEPRLMLFPDLTGFNEFETNMAIDWKLFFDFNNGAKKNTKERVQPSYKIDTMLVNPLGNLPKAISDHIPQMPNLAHLNLLRGFRLGLPSGQSVARAMGVAVIPDTELKIGKANAEGLETNRSIADYPDLAAFNNNAPLWFYVLAEALKDYTDAAKKMSENGATVNEINEIPVKLGKVGGTIVGEVFVGLLAGDKHSFLNQDPLWKPLPDFANEKGEFGIAELLSQAMLG